MLSRLTSLVGGGGGAPSSKSNHATASTPAAAPAQGANHGTGENRGVVAVASSYAHASPSSYAPEALAELRNLWRTIESQLRQPDQRALHHGVAKTQLPELLDELADVLVHEANQTDGDGVEVMGPCMEYCLNQDVFGSLVRLSVADRPAGVQREVVRLFSSLVVLLDERFLSRQAVHRPLSRLVRLCIGDSPATTESDGSEGGREQGVSDDDGGSADVSVSEDTTRVGGTEGFGDEDEDAAKWGRMGSAEAQGFEEDLVDLMCHVASRLHQNPQLLVVFFRRGVPKWSARRHAGAADAAAKSDPDAEASTAAPPATPSSRRTLASPPRESTPYHASTAAAQARPSSPTGSDSSTATLRAPPERSPAPTSLELPSFAESSLASPSLSSSSSVSPPTRPHPSLGGALERPETSSSSSSFTVADFPLFTYLLRFAYREGRTGELARAGLLLLLDVALLGPGRRRARRRHASGASNVAEEAEEHRRQASLCLALAEFVLASEFAEVVGAGLGAVYGLLPSKIAMVRDQDAPVTDELGEAGDGEKAEGRQPPGTAAAPPPQSALGRDMYLGRQHPTALLAGEPSDAGRRDIRGHTPHLGVSDDDVGVERSTSDAVTRPLHLLVQLIDFTQDVLGRVRRARLRVGAGGDDESAAAAVAAHARTAQQLEHQMLRSLRQLLLENIVYPAMLESSEADGSAVAAMSYLEVMLQSIPDDSTLAEAVVGWLLGHDDRDADDSVGAGSTDQKCGPTTSSSEAAKPRSMALRHIPETISPSASGEGYYTHASGRYTVKDLILGHLGPESPAEAKTAALRLATTLLLHHGRFALKHLLDVAMDDAATSFPFPFVGAATTGLRLADAPALNGGGPLRAHTLQQHAQELQWFFSLVGMLEQGSWHGGDGGAAPAGATGWSQHAFSSTRLDHYLADAEVTLMVDSTYVHGVRAVDGQEQGLISSARGVMPSRRDQGPSPSLQPTAFPCFGHRLRPSDGFLQAVLALLARFFHHTPEVNVALTALLARLAACPWRSLAGFLTTPAEVVDDAAHARGTMAAAGVGAQEDRGEEDLSGDEIFAPRQTAAEVRAPRPRTSWGDGGEGERVATPAVLGVLRSLVMQVQAYRSRIPDFDRYLAERRRGLLFVENLNDALQLDAEASVAGAPDVGNVTTTATTAAAAAAGLGDGGRASSQAALEKLWAQLDLVSDHAWAPLGAGVNGGASIEFRVLELPSRVPSVAPAASSNGATAQDAERGRTSAPDVQLTPPPKRQGFARWFVGRASAAAQPAAKSARDAPAADGSASSAAAAATTSLASPSAREAEDHRGAGAASHAPAMPFSEHYARTSTIVVWPLPRAAASSASAHGLDAGGFGADGSADADAEDAHPDRDAGWAQQLPPGEWRDAARRFSAPARHLPQEAPEQTLVAPRPRKRLRFVREPSYFDEGGVGGGGGGYGGSGSSTDGAAGAGTGTEGREDESRQTTEAGERKADPKSAEASEGPDAATEEDERRYVYPGADDDDDDEESGDQDDDDVGVGMSGTASRGPRGRGRRRRRGRERLPPGGVTLSSVLDNVVVLEEAIKELAAIVYARRALGFDPVAL